ncbi:DUF1501 domain-containing protein [Myxococcota bacterium]|nr:DUF1501 domain-containing protein [Myxococcota bacterium]
MDRRNFLKLCGGAGLALMTPVWMRGAKAQARDAEAGGPFWLFFHAGGGWDPTSLCDPKGAARAEDPDAMNHYLAADIETAGNLKYAPVAENAAFFQKHYRRLMVINGLDTQTNSHDAGTRHVWSGKLAEGYPSLAALIAATVAEERPMAFISNGGYDYTAGLIAPTRTGNIGVLNRIAFPNRIDGEPDGAPFHTDATWARINKYQEQRQPYLTGAVNLPKAQNSVSQLFVARMGQNEVKRLSEFLPETFEQDELKRQAQVAIAGFKAGISQAANLSTGGFDTHGNHDDSHFPRLQTLMAGVDFAWAEAERQGVADNLVIVVGSDFGRTPGYNSGNGKDHWSISSMLLMGKGIPGNRVVGVTDERHSPLPLDPKTLKPAASGGIRIEPRHVHYHLRKMAGLAGDPNAEQTFPLLGTEDLPLFKA